jgi:hypothetical protein
MPLSASAVSSIGGGVSDLFSGMGHKAKAAGDRSEATNYRLAASLADQNEVFTEWSTAIKQHQQDRENTKAFGGTTADVAGAGFAESGSALDILRESAAEGARTKAVLGEQGLITEAGYREQWQSYRNMSDAAEMAARAQDTASSGAWITGALKIGIGAASLAMGNPLGAAGVAGGAADLFGGE